MQPFSNIAHVNDFIVYDALAKNKNLFNSLPTLEKWNKRLMALDCEMEHGLHKCICEVNCNKFAFTLINI